MTTQPALVAETVQGWRTSRAAPPRRGPCRRRIGRGSWTTTLLLALCSLTVLIPLYVTVSMAFKTTEQAVDGSAFSLPAPFSLDGFTEAWSLTDFPGRSRSRCS